MAATPRCLPGMRKTVGQFRLPVSLDGRPRSLACAKQSVAGREASARCRPYLLRGLDTASTPSYRQRCIERWIGFEVFHCVFRAPAVGERSFFLSGWGSFCGAVRMWPAPSTTCGWPRVRCVGAVAPGEAMSQGRAGQADGAAADPSRRRRLNRREPQSGGCLQEPKFRGRMLRASRRPDVNRAAVC